jgi:hypothetical protein
MKKLAFALTLAVALLAAGAALAATSSTTLVTKVFKASYAGTAATIVNDSNVSGTATGKGTGTIVGASKIVGKIAGAGSEGCSTWGGTSTVKSAKGTLKLAVASTKGQACSSDQQAFTLHGSAKVTGGTLAFRHARGPLTFTGTFDRAGGHFTLKLAGKITY